MEFITEEKQAWKKNKKINEQTMGEYYYERMTSAPWCAGIVIGAMVMCGILILMVSACHAQEETPGLYTQVIQPAHHKQIASILYAESASDPQGWGPKLNTYNKARRSGETLVQSMKRVSSAYRKRSKQYQKAISGELNSYELKVFNRIAEFIRTFEPNKNWPYIHHENFKLYPNKQVALAHLKKAWGPGVDYVNCRQFGMEHYFGRCR